MQIVLDKCLFLKYLLYEKTFHNSLHSDHVSKRYGYNKHWHLGNWNIEMMVMMKTTVRSFTSGLTINVTICFQFKIYPLEDYLGALNILSVNHFILLGLIWRYVVVISDTKWYSLSSSLGDIGISNQILDDYQSSLFALVVRSDSNAVCFKVLSIQAKLFIQFSLSSQQSVKSQQHHHQCDSSRLK